MKYACVFLLWLGVLVLPTAVRAEEMIRSFDVDATLHPNRLLDIQERITYDFGSNERHGIFRTIPSAYVRNGTRYDLHIRHIVALMDGEEVPVDVSSSNGKIEIKIGDAHTMIRGVHAYTISYQTDRAINFFSASSELYWNVTGNDWPVAIEKAHFFLHAPDAPGRVLCFTGVLSSQEHACIPEIFSSYVDVGSARTLEPYEGLTVVAEFPSDAIQPLTIQEHFWQVVRDNWPVALPFVAIIFMGALWWTKGRDPRVGTIIPQYEPPANLLPADVGTIRRNGAFASRLITATIIDVARRGYLSIRYGEHKKMFGTEQTFTFVKTQSAPPVDQLEAYERSIYEGLFKRSEEVTFADLRLSSFFEAIRRTKRELEKRVDKEGVFDRRPTLIRALYIWIGVVIAGLSIGFFAPYAINIVAGLVTGAVIALIGWWMPRRTKRGTELLAQIKGFEWFLRVTEKERLAFHNAPRRTPEQFQTFLPYAIALKVENEWAKQFQDIEMETPSWMTGASPSSFTTIGFISLLNRFHAQANHSFGAYTTQAGSGSSGFSGGSSGGGFGGGGGGSW